MADINYLAGLDLGQASDFTALVALNFFFFLRVAITAIAHFRNMGIMQ